MQMDVSFKKSGSIPLHYIPYDCWYLVIDKLDSIDDQKSFGLTCHLFLDIQNSSRKRLELGFSRRPSMYPYAICDNMFDILLKRFRQLEILCLGAYHFRVTDSGLASLQKYPSKLRVLYLAYDNDVTDVGLAFIASGCQFLSVISLRSCSITDSGLEVLTKSCNLLEQVDLDGCNEIHDAGIWSLNQNCRKLRALNISGCLNIRGETFQGCSPELAYLEARYCRLHETGVTGILSGGGIEYLNLSFPQYGLVMNGLGFAANLKSLNLRGCKSVDDIAIMEISKGCLLLEELDVSSCDNFCDRGLQALGNGCKRLKMIWMESCDQLTRRGIRKFKRQRADVQINAQSDDNKATTMALDWTSTSRFQLHP